MLAGQHAFSDLAEHARDLLEVDHMTDQDRTSVRPALAHSLLRRLDTLLRVLPEADKYGDDTRRIESEHASRPNCRECERRRPPVPRCFVISWVLGRHAGPPRLPSAISRAMYGKRSCLSMLYLHALMWPRYVM